jgi:hypothetical protein
VDAELRRDRCNANSAADREHLKYRDRPVD